MIKKYGPITMGILLLAFMACNNTNTPTISLRKKVIDSSFVINLKTSNLKEIKSIDSFKIDDEGDQIYTIVKPRMKFWKYHEDIINDNLKVKTILSTEPKDMALDGSLNLVFLGLYNKNNQLTDLLRIGKYAMFSDIDELETSSIDGNHIEKKKRSREISDEGLVLTTNTIESYQITSDGKFRKL